MFWVCTEWPRNLPKLLLCKQKALWFMLQRNIGVCQQWSCFPGENSDKKWWVYVYNPKNKIQSSHWKSPSSPRPKEARQVRYKRCWFFYTIVHHEYISEGKTINKHQEARHCLCDAVWHKRPVLWKSCNWQLYHNNYAIHFSCLISYFFAKQGIS